MKFRKRPVVVEAEQFGRHSLSSEFEAAICTCFKEGAHHIHTLEGAMHVSDGDYIIKGVKGEFYPCKPAVFEASYEPALIGHREPTEAERKLGVELQPAARQALAK